MTNYERTGPTADGLRQGQGRVDSDKPNQVPDRRYFDCGREGHFARNCDQTRSSKPSGFPPDSTENANNVRIVRRNHCKVYLDVHVDGKPIYCLLDTGYEVNLILGFLVQELSERPGISQTKAENGSLIEVLGEVDFPVT